MDCSYNRKGNLSGSCSKCGNKFDLIISLGEGKRNFHDVKKVCLACREKKAKKDDWNMDGVLIPCSNCVWYGYSVDQQDGKHGRCANCLPNTRFVHRMRRIGPH